MCAAQLHGDIQCVFFVRNTIGECIKFHLDTSKICYLAPLDSQVFIFPIIATVCIAYQQLNHGCFFSSSISEYT